MKDYYALLGLTQKATKAEIKKNYRLLATKYHPDKSKDPASATKFIAITEAYDILSNSKRRVQYDLTIWEALKSKQATRDTYTTMAPPVVSTRTRRNRAQQKRSVNYHQSKSKTRKRLLLLKEAFYITCRYLSHLIGISLAAFLMIAASRDVSRAFQSNIPKGLTVCIFILALGLCIIKIGQHLIEELKKDVALFSVYYKISGKKAVLYAELVWLILFVVIGFSIAIYS